MVRILIKQELRKIAQSILNENKTVEDWAAVESDDMFQEGDYVGGFDADEGEFCFSYYGPDGEFWFQASLDQMAAIARGDTPELEGSEAE